MDTIFGYPGDGVNGLFEGMRTHQKRIRFIQVRHEEAAAFAACGYAKFTPRLGVCLATSGPGGLHLLNGLYDAKYDGQPVLAITGHTFHDLIGTHFQQDLDLDKVYTDVAAFNQRVMGPAHLHNVVDEAVTRCRRIPSAPTSERRGPMHQVEMPVSGAPACSWARSPFSWAESSLVHGSRPIANDVRMTHESENGTFRGDLVFHLFALVNLSMTPPCPKNHPRTAAARCRLCRR